MIQFLKIIESSYFIITICMFKQNEEFVMKEKPFKQCQRAFLGESIFVFFRVFFFLGEVMPFPSFGVAEEYEYVDHIEAGDREFDLFSLQQSPSSSLHILIDSFNQGFVFILFLQLSFFF